MSGMGLLLLPMPPIKYTMLTWGNLLPHKPRLYAQYTPRCKYTPGCKFAPGVYFGHINGVL